MAYDLYETSHDGVAHMGYAGGICIAVQRGDACPARGPGLRAGRQLARGIRRVHKIRNREVGKSHPGRRHPSGMIAPERARSGITAQKAMLTPARTPLPPIFTSFPLFPVVAARYLYCTCTPTFSNRNSTPAMP